MRPRLAALPTGLFAALAFAAAVQARPAADAVARGQGDGKAPGWTIDTRTPPGWTRDCCLYARAIGVDLVLYQGEWTGKPERVMVLNVWPAELPALDAEWQDDRKRYLERDPAGRAGEFPVAAAPPLQCHGLLYQGSDRMDDAVVFCDPGKAAGIRFSWSMTVAAGDPQRAALLAAFRQVVEQSTYRRAAVAPGSTGKAAAH